MRISARTRRAPERYAPAVFASALKKRANPVKRRAANKRAAVDALLPRGIEQVERNCTDHEKLVFSVLGEGSGLLRDRILAPMKMPERALAIFSLLHIGVISRKQAWDEWKHHIRIRHYWWVPECIQSAEMLPKLRSSHLLGLTCAAGLSGISNKSKAALASMLAPYAKSLEYTPATALGLLRKVFDTRKRRRMVAGLVGDEALRDVHVPTYSIWDTGVKRSNVLAALVQNPYRYVEAHLLTETLGLTLGQFEGIEKKPQPASNGDRWLLMSALRRAVEVHGDWQGICRARETRDWQLAQIRKRRARRNRKASRIKREVERAQREARRELAQLKN